MDSVLNGRTSLHGGGAAVARVSRWDFSAASSLNLDTQMRSLGRESPVPMVMHMARTNTSALYTHAQRNFGTVLVTDTEFDNFICTRTERLARDQSVPQFLLTLPSPGARFDVEGRLLTSTRHSLVGYWSVSPWALEITARSRCRTMTVHLDELGLPGRYVRDLVGRDLGASPLGGLLSRHLVDLVALPEMTVDAASALGRPTLDLVRALLSLAAGDEDDARGPLRRTLATRVVTYLRANLHDQALSADSVASYFGVSKRYLYVVLAEADVTLGEWVRERRMQLAAASLRDPALDGLPIVAIARSVGYSDHSSFSRTFKEFYGCSPREWRIGEN